MTLETVLLLSVSVFLTYGILFNGDKGLQNVLQNAPEQLAGKIESRMENDRFGQEVAEGLHWIKPQNSSDR